MPKGMYKHKNLSPKHKRKISQSLKGRSPWNKGKKVASHYKQTRKGKYIICPNCGTKKYRYPSQIDRYNIYCSKKCWYKHGLSKIKRDLTNFHEAARKFNTGRKFSKEHIEKIKIQSRKNARFGIKNNLWKGGIATLQNRVRQLPEYKEWRMAIFERDNYICQKCKDLNKHDLVAHHKETFAKIRKQNQIKTIEDAKRCKELWQIKNGITICHSCHEKIHGRVIPW